MFSLKSIYHKKFISKIYNKEMLAIVEAIKDWCQYLLGARQTFKVQSDYTNLTYFKAPHKLNYKQAC